MPTMNKTDLQDCAEWIHQIDEDTGVCKVCGHQEPGEIDMSCKCQNCDWTGPEADLNPIADIFERVAAGETMPAGECPKCGALCHAEASHTVSDPAYTARLERALSASLGAIAAMQEQIGQMSGMFDDEDGAIARAVEDGDDAYALGKAVKDAAKFDEIERHQRERYAGGSDA